MSKPEPVKYAGKAIRGERPFIYSAEYASWRTNPGEATASAWHRKFGLNGPRAKRYKPCVFAEDGPAI